jgi:Lon protease-like protein
METNKAYQKQPLIPLFPLGVVLLPHMKMPLHIFEERYKVMIHECIDQGKPFGIVYFDGKQIQKTGCTANITKVLKRYGDGRMDILTIGEKRFYIEYLDESKTYLQAGVLYIEDQDEKATDEDDTLVHQAIRLLKSLDQVSGIRSGYDRVDELDLQQMSFMIPASEGFTMEERQRFLEMTSPHERIQKGVDVLKKVILRAEINQEISRIIGSNGQIRAFLAEKGIL